ncbi:hypothetical protein Lal_00019299 [Lupinus albus]|nr:hypothetical protein Lal_00019299 [Lupinus albus]
MTIIRDIFSDFSDEDEIDLCGDDEEEDNIEIDSSELQDSDIPIKALVEEIVSCFRYTVTYRKAWIAKQLEMNQIYGDCEGSYNDLPCWMNVVQNLASGTIVRYEASRHFVDGNEDPISFILDKVFWAFKPCIEGFEINSRS